MAEKKGSHGPAAKGVFCGGGLMSVGLAGVQSALVVVRTDRTAWCGGRSDRRGEEGTAHRVHRSQKSPDWPAYRDTRLSHPRSRRISDDTVSPPPHTNSAAATPVSTLAFPPVILALGSVWGRAGLLSSGRAALSLAAHPNHSNVTVCHAASPAAAEAVARQPRSILTPPQALRLPHLVVAPVPCVSSLPRGADFSICISAVHCLVSVWKPACHFASMVAESVSTCCLSPSTGGRFERRRVLAARLQPSYTPHTPTIHHHESMDAPFTQLAKRSAKKMDTTQPGGIRCVHSR
ncbi:hypothetical protein PSPO01_15970 [Paraphaeosphaeria sporulosa]